MDREIIRSNRKKSDYLLPSRRGALAACRAALESGPILLTGASGVGKTWLLEMLAREDADRAWVALDCAPCMTPEDFLYTFASAIGPVPSPSSVGAARVVLDSGIREARDDGRPVALAFDEAHLASDMLLEEIRLIANRMATGRGLASLIISGQSSLTRRIDSKPLAALETRLAARVHLLPLDLSETGQLLGELRPGLAADRDLLERIHRDSTGNPARLFRTVHRLPDATAPALPRDPEPMIPAKPPLRVEEGLIEVGWDSESEPEAETEIVAEFVSSRLDENRDARNDEEPIEDHYAALQAWDEWAKNQGRLDLENASLPEADDLQDEDEPGTAGRTALGSAPGLWSEGKHGFGPYSQLFSRMKPLQGAD